MIESLLLSNLSWMRGIARTFCRNRTDAEDLVSETVLKILLNADKFDEARSFRLWVLVIMRNLYRSSRRHTGIVEPYSDLPDCTCGSDPATHTVVGEYMNIIRTRAETSVSVRSALLYAQGYSYSEIASMQGVGVNAVKSRIHHGRRLIMKSLSG